MRCEGCYEGLHEGIKKGGGAVMVIQQNLGMEQLYDGMAVIQQNLGIDQYF